MRAARSLLVGFVVTGAGSLAYGAKFVQDGVPEKPGDPKPLNCGGVHGSIGRIGNWLQQPSTDTNATAQRSAGEYGGSWGADADHRQQFEHTGPVTDSKTDKIQHKYTKVSGSPDYKFVSVNVTSKPVFSGASELLDASSPGWWWICPVHSYQQRPYMRYKLGNGDWISPALDSDGNPDDDVGHANGGEFDAPAGQNPGDNVSSSPAPTNPPTKYPVPAGHSHWQPNKDKLYGPVTNAKPCNYPESEGGYTSGDPHKDPLGGGTYGAVTTTELPGGATDVEIELQLDVTATCDVDNAKVIDWKSALWVDFMTETHQNKPQ